MARSAPHILSINNDWIFRFSNFSITSLCSSSVNSLFYTISLLTVWNGNLLGVGKVFNRACVTEVLEPEVLLSKDL